ncbi:SAM-dependent methyltransferase [Chloroflexales bacterium ZM16-3]|nr:SAM-dependent methyltransferase [Chloroflexales bacterium ZM16-3]
MPLADLLDRAIAARAHLLDERHQSACRLFTGFAEGCPQLAIDLYATTAVLHNYADPPAEGVPLVEVARRVLGERLPWLSAIVLKTRHAATPEEQAGSMLAGERAARRIREHGVWYAVNLTLNRDASLYLDTSGLRAWLIERMADLSVLNTFAYTGSLGVAALAGGASRVVQLDLSRRFMNLAKDSYTLNGLPVVKADFLTGDFWPLASRLKRAGERFDCVILDPPIFAATGHGVVDLASNYARLINKLRPLVASGGRLVAINNALFLSGAAYMEILESVCQDGYVRIAERIDVPEDCTGYPDTRVGAPVSDPAPFNHATKIAVLEVKHKASPGG